MAKRFRIVFLSKSLTQNLKIENSLYWKWQHRCWWQMLETVYAGWDVGDWFIAKNTKMTKKSPTLWFCRQHLKTHTSIKSPTYYQHTFCKSIGHFHTLSTDFGLLDAIFDFCPSRKFRPSSNSRYAIEKTLKSFIR